MPRKPKSSVLKLISGTLRKDRARPSAGTMPPGVLLSPPPPPEWLSNVHAQDEWKRLAALLVEERSLAETHLSALAVLCALHSHLVQTWAAGEMPRAALLAQYRLYQSDFGLTPSSRGRIERAPPAPDANPFARNGKPGAPPRNG